MPPYIVGTPIGNLGDLTIRALETLRNVDKVYAEDTRRTRQLLRHYQIDKPVASFHQYSSAGQQAQVIAELKRGQRLAYLTDAGTPGIADPGGKLVRLARDSRIKIIPIPGISAVTTLLSVSGVPADSFWFVGYLPTKKGRRTLLEKIIQTKETVVLFETAPRLTKFLQELSDLNGQEKTLIIGRELTKRFEEIVVGSPVDLRRHFALRSARGELTIVISQ